MWVPSDICVISRIRDQFGRGSHGGQEGSGGNWLATASNIKGVTTLPGLCQFLSAIHPLLQHSRSTHDFYAQEGETTPRVDTGSYCGLPEAQGEIHHGSHPALPRSRARIYRGGGCFQYRDWCYSLPTTWRSFQIIPLCFSLSQTHPHGAELWRG